MNDLSIKMAKNLEFWPLGKIKPYAKNARTHSEEQIDQIASSIVEFGFTNPILVDSQKGIIAGHGRLLAATKLEMETVPVIVLDHLDETQRRAYIIADNQLALNAGWDEGLLAEELEALNNLDFQLDIVGFDEKEIERLLERVVEDEPEAQAEVDEKTYKPKFQVVVDCEDEADQEAVYRLVSAKGYQCKVLTL